jgi:hypothetical protein
VAYTLDWLMFFSDKSKLLTIGIVSVAGVVAGSAVYVAVVARIPLGRLSRPGRGQPPGGRPADGRGRRHRHGLHHRGRA